MTAFQVEKIQLTEQLKQSLVGSLPKLKGRKILVIGDVGLDEYVLGEVRRISPEAPVPVLEVSEEDMRLGLAANVAQNIASLGGEAFLVSVVGQDTGGVLLRDLAVKSGFSWDHVIATNERPTTRKMRVMAGHHHLVRVDHEVKKFIASHIEDQVLEKIKKLAPQVDIIIIEDYAKGVVSGRLMKSIVEIGQQFGKKVLLDPHRDKTGDFYHGVGLIKPNYEEAVALSGLKFDELKENPDKVYEVGAALKSRTQANEVVLTRGKEGMTIFSGQRIIEVPTYARKVFDVTGAGDTVIAAMALGLAANLTLVEACMLANFAAGVVVGKVGCVPCEVAELVEYINTSH